MKANYAERAIKTIKTTCKMYRYMTFKQSKRYIDRLQEFVGSYNKTFHALLTPNLNWLSQATKKRWAYLHSYHETFPGSKPSDHTSSKRVITFEFRKYPPFLRGNTIKSGLVKCSLCIIVFWGTVFQCTNSRTTMTKSSRGHSINKNCKKWTLETKRHSRLKRYWKIVAEDQTNNIL